MQSLRREQDIADEKREQGMKLYRVHVRVEGTYFVDKWATCEEDAIEEFKDEFDIDYCDMDIEFDGEEL